MNNGSTKQRSRAGRSQCLITVKLLLSIVWGSQGDASIRVRIQEQRPWLTKYR